MMISRKKTGREKETEEQEIRREWRRREGGEARKREVGQRWGPGGSRGDWREAGRERCAGMRVGTTRCSEPLSGSCENETWCDGCCGKGSNAPCTTLVTPAQAGGGEAIQGAEEGFSKGLQLTPEGTNALPKRVGTDLPNSIQQRSWLTYLEALSAAPISPSASGVAHFREAGSLHPWVSP